MARVKYQASDGTEHWVEADTPEQQQLIFQHIESLRSSAGQSQLETLPTAPSSETKAPTPAPQVTPQELVTPGVDFTPPARPSAPTLAGDSLRRPPMHLILPYPGAITRVPSRYTQEQWDRKLQVEGLARQIEENVPSRPGTEITRGSVTTNAMGFGFQPQVRALGHILGSVLSPGQSEIDTSVPVSERYALYRDAERRRLEAWQHERPWQSLGLSLLGGLTAGRPVIGGVRLPPHVQGPPAPPPPGAPLTTGQQMGVAAGYGSAGGAVQGAAENPETWEDTVRGVGRGAAGGAVIGPAAYLGLRGLGAIPGIVRGLRRPEVRERAAVWRELGVEPPPLATLPGPARRAAEFVGPTLWGRGLQTSTGAGATRLEQSLSDALRFGGGPRTATAAGEEAQALTRNALTSRRSVEELRNLPREEVDAMGLGTTPPAPVEITPRVTPTTPEEIATRHRRSLRDRLNETQSPPPSRRMPTPGRRSLSERLAAAGGDEVTPSAAPSQAPPPPPTTPGRRAPDLTTREGMIQAEVESVPPVRPYAPNAPVESNVMTRQAQIGPRRAEVPPSAQEVPLTAGEARRLYLAQERVRRASGKQANTARVDAAIQALRRRLTWARRLEQTEHANAERAPFWESNARSAAAARRTLERQELERTLNALTARREGMLASSPSAQAQRRLERVQEQIAAAQQQRFVQATASERQRFTNEIAQSRAAALHESTREAEALARLRNAEAHLAQVTRAQERARTQWEAYELEARAETIKRQAQADVEYLAQKRAEEAQARAAGQRVETPPTQPAAREPLQLPRSGESYPTQLAAAELALSRRAPSVQGRLLGLKNDPTRTHFIRELEAIALEARAQGRAPGYKRLFSLEDESLHPGLVQYLAEELGMRTGQVLEPAAGRAMSPQQRFVQLLDILVRQRRGEFAQGLHGTSQLLDALHALRQEPGVNRDLLERITNAIRRDLQSFAALTPEGTQWSQQLDALRLTKERIERELAEPLRQVTGNSNPAAALQVLQQSLREGGNLNVVRAFLQIAAEKGDRTAAVSLLLTGMRGRNLGEFVRNWRALTPEARQLMFQGPTQALGARLERFAGAAEQIQGFPTGYTVRDTLRTRNLLQGLWAYLDIPSAAAGAVGQIGADRLLSSQWFQRWLLRAPLELGPNSGAWKRHVAGLSGLLGSVGLEQETGRRVISIVQALMSSASAEQPPPTTPGGGAPPPNPRKGSTQREAEPQPEWRDLPPWHRAEVGVEAESVFERNPLGPDPEVLLGRPRPRRRASLNQWTPTAGEIVRRNFDQYLPRGSAEMARRVIDHPLNPITPAFEGGRLLAEGVHTGRPDLAALGAFLALPAGGSELGIFIGLPGARNLARQGKRNAEHMLDTASRLERAGMPVPEIQALISRRLYALNDQELGTVLRLPDGQWAIELGQPAPAVGRLAEYQRAPLGALRDDPMLYGAHPVLRGVPVWHFPDLEELGYLGHASRQGIITHRAPNTLGVPRVLEHELQHMSSRLDRFPGGATVEAYEPGGILEHLRPANMSPRQAYDNTADEWLAEQAAERMYYPLDARRGLPVTAPDNLIVHHWGEAAPSAGMARPREWTEERMREIARLLRSGKTRDEIAAQFGVSRLVLDRAIQRYGR